MFKVPSQLRLVGERVVLRSATPEDLEGFHRVFTDPEVMRYVGYGRPLTAAEVGEWVTRMIARFDTDEFGQLALTRRADGALMGRAGLLPLDPNTWQSGSLVALGSKAEIEIGWTLAREFWGHGYATEAAVLVRDWGWRDLGFPRLVSIIQLGNNRSVRLAEKLGGQLEREIMTSFGKRAQLFAYARRAR
jgi:RimJ/RimL family protein N-acetyltransferase